MKDITVAELFAGVGGFRIGLEKASTSFRTIWANQWEPDKKKQHAFDCYDKHFGPSLTHSNEDIAVAKKNCPSVDLLVGGFPCQDYSVAHSGGAKGIEGKKGVLWWYINDIIGERKPDYVLLENVDRLLKSPAKQRGRDFAIILRCLYDQGYYAEWRVINAAEYGYPQRRRRVFIFAARKTTKWYSTIVKSADESVRIVMYKSGFFADQFKVRGNDIVREFDLKTKPDGNDYVDLVDISNNFKAEFGNTGFMLNGKVYTSTTTPYPHKQKTLADIVESDGVDDKYFLGENLAKWEYMKGAKKIERTAANGHSYMFSEGPIAFPDPLDRPSRTMLTSESSTNRSTHIIADPKTGKLRFLTPVECERLNGFPDNWTNTGMPEKFRYFCMGNALVVPLITRMGKQLLKITK